MPSTIGSTVSRWLGLAASSTLMSAPDGLTYLPDRAEVVLHVAGALDRRRVDVALELPEDLVVALAHDVGQHVEPAAVGHAEDRAVEPAVGGRRQHLVEDGDRGLRALEPEALGADVLRGQEPLERLGRVQPLEEVAQLVRAELDLDPLDLGLDPALLVGVLDVHVLDADRAAVRVAEHAEQVAERASLLARHAAGEELAVEVPDRQPVGGRVELVRHAPALSSPAGRGRRCGDRGRGRRGSAWRPASACAGGPPPGRAG